MSAKQRAAGWGTDKPTVAGVYWYRRKDMTVKVLQVDEYLTVRGINIYAEHVKSCDGEWLGPITPDAYAVGRVAGLLSAKREWDAWIVYNDQAPLGKLMTFKQWIDERVAQIEAQAQGGSVRCQRCGGSGYTQSDDPARPLSRCGTCQGDGRYQPSRAQGGMR